MTKWSQSPNKLFIDQELERDEILRLREGGLGLIEAKQVHREQLMLEHLWRLRHVDKIDEDLYKVLSDLAGLDRS